MSVPDYASIIHKHETAQFLATAFEMLKEEDLASKNGQMILAYWMGFLCHYALDTTAHPYIYYFSGINNDEAAKESGEKHNHKFLENIIDTLLSVKYENIMNLPRSQYDCLPKNPASLMPAYQHVSKVFKAVYESELKPEVIQESVADMKKLAGLLHDPKRKRRWMFSKIEDLISKPRYITTAAYPAASDLEHDFLNLGREKWVHPCDDSYEYDDSFMDLFDKSIDLAKSHMEYAWETFKNVHTKDEHIDELGNYSYDTGLKCGDPRDLRFSDSLFNKEPDPLLKTLDSEENDKQSTDSTE